MYAKACILQAEQKQKSKWKKMLTCVLMMPVKKYIPLKHAVVCKTEHNDNSSIIFVFILRQCLSEQNPDVKQGLSHMQNET